MDDKLARQSAFLRESRVGQLAPPPAAGNLEAPHLFEGELELLTRLMRGGYRRYLEFGTGGSTLLAVRGGFERIVAIDSDPTWVAAVRAHPEIAEAIASGRADIRHADIGPLADWGNPRNRDHVEQWPTYIRTAWEAWSEHAELPDLVFVDGRFRVACCLSVILAVGADAKAAQGLRVALHDAGPERPYYDALLEFFDVVERVNTLQVMQIKPKVSAGLALSVLLHRQFDQQ